MKTVVVEFEAMSAPKCRHCGKPIRKRTTMHIFDSHCGDIAYFKVHDPRLRPANKADCQALTNETVVSVRYHDQWRDGEKIGRRLSSFTTWDGESYVDPFFCNGTCALNFAYMCARAGIGRKAAKQEER